MKITKLIHSCLLVEKDDKKILVDPGAYSWNSGIINREHLKGIDFVVITHEHPDHCDETFIKAVYEASPDTEWFSTTEVAGKLLEFGITVKTESHNKDIRFITSEHADLSPWFAKQPEHTSFVLFDELLIGGDCHSLTRSHGARIFGGAINGGPWGAVVGFTKMIEAMTEKPEAVIPLHDWHFNEDAKSAIYAKLPEVLGQFDVQFVPLENGIPQDI